MKIYQNDKFEVILRFYLKFWCFLI